MAEGKSDVDEWLDATQLSDTHTIVEWTKKKRNSWYLVDYVRKGGEITPEIAALLADIIEGLLYEPPITYREPPATDLVHIVRLAYKATLARLRAGDEHLEKSAWKLLGIRASDDKRRMSTVARELVALAYDVSTEQVKEYSRPRAAQRKRGVRHDAGTSRKKKARE